MDKQARALPTTGRQWRSYPAAFEVRSLPGGPLVELSGYASVYDTPYEMFDWAGPYTEVARAGMCAKTLSEGADVAYLANHEGLTLARTKTGTLRLSEDTTGLLTAATLNTTRSDARNLVTAVEDGAIDQMSFAFRIVRQEWSPDYEQRDLVEVNLNRGDVSAVNFGASPVTSVGVQRDFRSRPAAELHRMAVQLREGKALSAATLETLSQVLDLIASADTSLDAAQPALAGLMGVPNPDVDDEGAAAEAAEAERALGYLNVLRLQNAALARTR